MIRDLDKLWILNLNTNMYTCYDHDEVDNRIFIGEYKSINTIGETQQKKESFEEVKKSLNGKSYKGVSLHKQSYQNGFEKCWHSRLNIPSKNGEKGKRINLGSFKTPTEAAIAWNNAVIEAGLESIRGLNEV